jgi:hypothetical protein
METLNSKVIDCLKKDFSEGQGISAYMSHIIIQVEKTYDKLYQELKTEITVLVETHFPERSEDLFFTFCKEGIVDEDFKVPKTA